MQKHIIFDAAAMRLHLLDQRLLPGECDHFICHDLDDVIYAIKNMVVRGAPAIGVTAAYGCVLAALAASGHELALSYASYDQSLDKLSAARPTAVNLAWAVNRMRQLPDRSKALSEQLPVLLAEADAIAAEDEHTCREIGRIGASLVQDGDTILTHCNAGALATAGYGTALGVIRAAWEQGKKISVIADETRPLLQGARLTAWELAGDGIPVTIACDNACALLLAQKKVQLILTGADRVAANGDTANKIGTFSVAIIAKYFNVPFYVACPLSTIDAKTATGAQIPIEQRSADEVLSLAGSNIAPAEVPAFNYAFDVTPANLIAGIITEAGILRPPCEQSIHAALNTVSGGH